MDNQDVQTVVNSYSMIIILSLAMVIALIWWASATMKKHPEMTFGDMMNAMLIKQKLSIFIISVILLNISEAIMAASITPLGETPINPLARLLSHSMVALVSILCGLKMPTSFKEIFNSEKRIAVSVFIFILTVVGTFTLPYINVYLIASGLKQMQLLNLYTLSLNPLNNMPAYYQSIGLPAQFSPLGAMQYPMVVSVAIYYVHVFLVVLDGAYIIHNKPKPKTIEVKDGKKSDTDKKPESEKSQDPIRKLINRYSNNNLAQDVVDSKIKQAHAIHDGLNAVNKSKLSSNIASMMNKVEQFDRDSSNLSSDEKKEAKLKLRKEIRDFFAQSTKDGAGFGITLPKAGDLGN